jgi:hypothetical protein
LEQLPARPEVAPEHRSWRQAPPVRVQLVPAGPTLFEAGLEQVDQPLGIAQLLRCHAVELAAAEHLALTVGVGRDDHVVDRGIVIGAVGAGRDRHATLVRRRGLALATCLGRCLAAVRFGRVGLVRRPQRWRLELAEAPSLPLAPPAVEDGVVGGTVVAAVNEDGLPGTTDLLTIAHLDEGHASGEVDGGAEIDGNPCRTQRPSEPDRFGEEPSTVDGLAPRRLDDGGIRGHRASQLPVRASAR